MTTARDYLAGKGLAIAGARGKFSNAAKEELARSLAAGMTFSDWPKGVTAPVKSSPVSKDGAKREAKPVGQNAGDSAYVFPSDFRFPEGKYEAKDATGKRYSVRECCNTCRVSLTNHACNTPSIYGDIAVTIVRR